MHTFNRTTIFTQFILESSNDAFNPIGYTASNGRMTMNDVLERFWKKDMTAHCKDLYQHLPACKTLVRIGGLRIKI